MYLVVLSGGKVGKKSFITSLLISSECFAVGAGKVLGSAEVLATGCGGDTGSGDGGDGCVGVA